ncbi:hypothetical protein [uncultured Cohaesibacter sp.]|uniref:hypothetical protein n=1 Tax=uncultured Cohaesibacter sp. TaxID=1002546 RepID=UPI0029C77A23|nr:hypothetical protein [uncultured Cohaesibacter sp.]
MRLPLKGGGDLLISGRSVAIRKANGFPRIKSWKAAVSAVLQDLDKLEVFPLEQDVNKLQFDFSDQWLE